MTFEDVNSRPLVILGGKPAFDEPLHVGRPNLGSRDALLGRIQDSYDRRWLTNDGPLVREFEQRVAKFIGIKHVVATSNCTVALEMAIRAAGLTGEVIIPSFTFVATAHALQWQEIAPVFCDIDPATHTIDPECIERLVTPRTTGIIGVHLWGRPCNVRALTEIAKGRGLTLLFDAAHAFGCSYNGQMIGNFGTAEVLSFHATKFVNSFEGGAVVTNDDALADQLRLMRNFGFAGEDNVIYLGTNAKMNEASAAMGLTSLEAVDHFSETNNRNYQAYIQALSDAPGVSLLPYAENERCNYQYIVLEIDQHEAGLNRDELIAVLRTENVLARRYFWPGCHRMEPYRSLYPNSSLWLPHTERVASRVIVLPTGTATSTKDVAIVGEIIRSAIAQSAPVRSALERFTKHSIPLDMG